MTVRDGPGAAHTPRSKKASAGRGAPPTTAPAPPRSALRRANSRASTSSTKVRESGSLSSVGAERRASRSKRRRTMSPAQQTTIASTTARIRRLSTRLPQKLPVWGVRTRRVVTREVIEDRVE